MPASAYERGELALARHRLPEALELFSQAVTVAGTADDRANALNKCGVALVRLGRRDAARAEFAAALGERERFAPALVNLGNLVLEAGDSPAAIARDHQAIAADEGYALAYLNLGIAYKRAGRHAESVRLLRTATRLELRTPPRGR